MNYQHYQELFDDILNDENPSHPYDDEHYLNYTKLNKSRMKRWDKLLKLDNKLIEQLNDISSPQHWIIITEPWCGDAAHIIPFLIQMIGLNTLITYDIQLRDSEPFLIESYLTNGSKSIPKLIVRNPEGEDLFNWGPRPLEAQQLMDSLKAEHKDFETIKISLQQWYNEDKGVSLCMELGKLLLDT